MALRDDAEAIDVGVAVWLNDCNAMEVDFLPDVLCHYGCVLESREHIACCLL